MKYWILGVALCLSSSAMAQNTTSKVQHKVEKQETIYGIAKQYGITTDQLIEANPEMKQPGFSLKKGAIINIPQQQNNAQEQKAAQGQTNANTSAQQQQPVTQTVAQQNKVIKVGVMLPLHDQDNDGLRMVEYYRGLLLACDRMKKDGINVDMYAWNVPKGADINKILEEKKEAAQCNIIIGPLYTDQLKPLAEFCNKNAIQLVIPFSIEGEPTKNYENVFQVYQSAEVIEANTINKFFERFANYHPVIIDCGDPNSTKGKFTAALRKELDKRGVKYSLTSLTTSDNDFAKAFSMAQPNVVILNTQWSPKLNETLAKLNILTNANKNVNIAMLGYTEWLMYTKAYANYYHKYEAYIPTYFYYNETHQDTKWVEAQYKSHFDANMDANGLPRFAITGFDHGCFFIGGYNYFGQKFTGGVGQVAYKPVQSPLRFVKDGKGLKNNTFMFIHYLKDGNIQSVSY